MQHQKTLWHEKKEFTAPARAFNAVLRLSSIFARTPPNLVTAACALLVPIMCVAFLCDSIVIGAVLYTAISLGDGFDGAMARYQERLHREDRLPIWRGGSEWLQRGETPLGKKLDPLVDKLCYFAALIPLGWHTLPFWKMAVSIGIALTLTALRPFALKLWGIQLSSNAYGKIKAQFERAAIACFVFQTAYPWLKTFSYAAFTTATLLAMLSLLGQCWSLRDQLKNRTL